MSDTADAVTEPAPEQAGEAQSKPQSLEDLLADVEEGSRKVVLEQVNKARSEAKNLRERLKAAEPQLAEYNRLVEASKSELDRAQEAAQTNAQRAQVLLDRTVNAEIRALASGFADPEDAATFLSGKQYADDDGNVDTAAIKADLSDLLSRKPHLAASEGGTGRRAPRPDHSQASGANGPTAASPASQFASILQGQLRQQ